jgi:hypothetical protein
MKIKPILFNPEMVAAIFNGRKTQTRRLLKAGFNLNECEFSHGIEKDTPERERHFFFRERETEHFLGVEPKFQIGDTLYVRESFYDYGNWQTNDLTKTGKLAWKFVSFIAQSDPFAFEYHYNEKPPQRVCTGSDRTIGWHKRNPLFMPKSAARLFLEVTDVRLEKLHDITGNDAMDEGVEEHSFGMWWDYIDNHFDNSDPEESFFSLWESINGKKSLDSNPFVWAYTFFITDKPTNFK